jgi:hypothetical protein
MVTVQANGKATDKDLLARIAQLEAENVRLKQSKLKSLSMKVSEKGALSVYGLGRFPVSLYRGQWERLIALVPEIQEFIKANQDKLATKD